MNVSYGYEFFFISLLGMLTLLGLPLPFSVPPLPEEPALTRVAPVDSMMLMSWNGTAAVNPNSTNSVERLAAEPEVRAMFEQFHAGVLRQIGKQTPAAATGIAQRSLDLLVTMLNRPGCVFLHDLQFAPAPAISGGIVIKLDRDMMKAKALIGVLEIAMASQMRGEKHEDIEIDDVRFRALPISNEYSFLGWAEIDGWFALVAGDQAPAQVVAGLKGTDEGLLGTASFASLQRSTTVARPALRTYVDIHRVLQRVGGAGGTEMRNLMAALGLGKATQVMSTSGLEGDGACYRLRLLTSERDGLLAAFDGAPLVQDELLHIPADADISLSSRIDAKVLQDALLALFDQLEPGTTDDFERYFVSRMKQDLGIDWNEDVIGQIGDQLTLWNAPSQGGALFTSLAGTMPLRDGKAAQQTLRDFASKVRAEGNLKADEEERLRRNRAYLEPLMVGDLEGYWVDVMDDDVFIAPAWIATDDRFFWSLMPQPVRAAVARADIPNPDESIARLAQVNRRGKATAMLQLDLQGLLRQAWPLLAIGVKVGSSEWQRDGFPLDVSMLPSPTAVLPHLGQEITLLEPVEDGWAVTRTGHLPVIDPMTAVSLVALIGSLGRGM